MASSSQRSSIAPWVGLAALVIVLDQLAKAAIVRTMQLGDVHRIYAWFDIVRAHNTGAAFSFLRDASGWQRPMFIALGLAAAVFIVWMLRRHAAQTLFAGALAFILGGALGNVIDRVWHGYVVDFIQVHHGSWYFPAFNLADSAITLGAALLILDELRRVRKS